MTLPLLKTTKSTHVYLVSSIDASRPLDLSDLKRFLRPRLTTANGGNPKERLRLQDASAEVQGKLAISVDSV